MKKILLLILIPVLGMSQNQFSFGFDGTTAAMVTAGWTQTNQSTSPSTTALWSNATYTAVVVNGTVTPANAFGNQTYADGQTSPIPNGQAGGANSFALVNFASTTSTASTGATISNWLITPTITVQNGDVVSFFSRKGTSGTTDYADRLELRMSSLATHVNPSTGPTDVGSFTTLCTSVNPSLLTGFVYPKTWTQYSYTVAGLSAVTPVKFAFRYHVTNGGTNGANSDIIGLDTFSVDRTLSTDSFFNNNFSIYPNPVVDIINISSLNNTEISKVAITDINGRIVKEVISSVNNFSVNELNAGIYFLKIFTKEGTGTSKFVKN